MSTETVFLASAYRWVCPACGDLQYADPMPIDLTPKELAEVQRKMSHLAHETVSLGDGKVFVTSPSDVTCVSCGLEFSATDGSDA